MGSLYKFFISEISPFQGSEQLRRIYHILSSTSVRHKYAPNNIRAYRNCKFQYRRHAESGSPLSRWFFQYKNCFYGYGRMLLSASPIILYDWKKNNVTEEQIQRCFKEFESVEALCNATVYCRECHLRKMFDQAVTDIDYCKCNARDTGPVDPEESEGWEPFLERDNILVWRKKHEKFTNLYCYKVYGKYEDLSASAFTEVQLNVENRTIWDTTALELKVLDSFKETNSDLLYWKVKFPRFFSDRDYVYKRRYDIFEDRKQIVIYNEATVYESAPPVSGNHRVKDYWAMMVVKADIDFNKPGMSYTLTYFDNPGTTLPQAVTNFVATKSFPEFLSKVITAARDLQNRWNRNEDVYVTLPENLRFQKSPSKSISPQSSQEESSGVSVDELSSKSIVTMKMGSLKDVMKELLRPTSLINLENLQDTVTNILEKGAQKKEESLHEMRKFEEKRNYNHLYDVSTQALLAKLLISIHELLEADKNMRTGKGFCSEDPKKYSAEQRENVSDCSATSLFSEKSTDGFYLYYTPAPNLVWLPDWYIQLFRKFSQLLESPLQIRDSSSTSQTQLVQEEKVTNCLDSESWTVYIVRSCYKAVIMILKLLNPEKV